MIIIIPLYQIINLKSYSVLLQPLPSIHYLLHFECASLGQFAGDHGNAAAVSVRGGGAVGLHWGTGRRGWAV